MLYFEAHYEEPTLLNPCAFNDYSLERKLSHTGAKNEVQRFCQLQTE